ncbi:LysR family transcriptional regulator [Novosphingobium flavum]|uniref:LysR family transcriptional regulator n=1 Tax=Novosphingobium flavum TaxID=1778672 RepID=A0A7X1FRZ1_9SPHN|nr:LysR family transcriptional regulator [Novosphingobium flavum]MBC2665860.1 LysR family transcriptional regulator [Novosphingobium flavum]
MFAELRTLIAVSRWGTFSRAGERVGLTQAAVSGQMKRLEEQLGFSLFERTGRSARLNVAGLRTVERARAILASLEALGDPEECSAAGLGTLRIGAISSLQAPLLARALGPLSRAYPGLALQVVPGLGLNLLDQVDSGELDLAVMIRPPFDLPAELAWDLLARDRYSLIAPAALASEDWRGVLTAQPFLRYDRLSFGGRQVDRFIRSLPFPVTLSIEVPVQSMVTMVESGLGVALVPLAEERQPLPPGVVALPLPGVDLARETGVVRPRGHRLSAVIDNLVEILREVSAAP